MDCATPARHLESLDVFGRGGIAVAFGWLGRLFFRPKVFHSAEDALGRAERIAASSTMVFALTVTALPFHYLVYYLADAWHYVRWPTFEAGYTLHVLIIVLVPSFVIYVVTMFFALFLRPSLVVGSWFVAAGFNLWIVFSEHGFTTLNAARFFLALHITLYFLGGFLVGCLRVARAELMTIIPVAAASMSCLAESNPLITGTFGWPGSTMGWLHLGAFTLGFARPFHMAIHPLWVVPRPRGRYYRLHPAAWDHRSWAWYPGLAGLLVDFHRFEPERARAEIARLEAEQPLHRAAARRARSIIDATPSTTRAYTAGGRS